MFVFDTVAAFLAEVLLWWLLGWMVGFGVGRWYEQRRKK